MSGMNRREEKSLGPNNVTHTDGHNKGRREFHTARRSAAARAEDALYTSIYSAKLGMPLPSTWERHPSRSI